MRTLMLFAFFIALAPSSSDSGPEVRVVRANGASLAYMSLGRGAPVVLVHGSLADYRIWSPQVSALSRRNRVIAYSRRFHWPNPSRTASDPDYSNQLHAADLAALIQKLRLGRVHLVGHSAGGAIAVQMALEHPKLVRSLTLIEPGIYSILPQTDEGRSLLAEIARASVEARDALARGEDAAAIRILMDLVFRPRTFAELAPDIRQALLDNASSLRAQFASAEPPPAISCADAARLRMPVLLLEGEKTAPEFRLINNELERCLRVRERVRIPSAGHGLTFEHPALVNAALLRFLSRKH